MAAARRLENPFSDSLPNPGGGTPGGASALRQSFFDPRPAPTRRPRVTVTHVVPDGELACVRRHGWVGSCQAKRDGLKGSGAPGALDQVMSVRRRVLVGVVTALVALAVYPTWWVAQYHRGAAPIRDLRA